MEALTLHSTNRLPPHGIPTSTMLMLNYSCNHLVRPVTRVPIVQRRALSSKPALTARRKPAVKTMAFTLNVPADYAYVCFTLFASVVVHHIYMAVSVGQARKR